MDYSVMTKHQLIQLDKEDHFKQRFEYRPHLNSKEVIMVLTVTPTKVFGYHQFHELKTYFHLKKYEKNGRQHFNLQEQTYYMDFFTRTVGK